MKEWICTLLLVLALIWAVVSTSGCATGLVNSHYTAQDASALRVVGMDNGGVGVGLDMFQWREVAAHPFAHLAGLGVDTASVAGIVTLVKNWLSKQQGDSGSTVNAPPPTISVQGNGNTVNYGNSGKRH